MIKNNVNHKVYIGQSSDISKRWKKHIQDLDLGIHHNRHLQNAWDKYGKDSFSFSVLEECEKSVLDEREIYYIKYYKSHSNGYNLDDGGDGCIGYKHSLEEIEKMRKAQNPTPIMQFDLNFNLINIFEGGISQASKTLGYTRDCIKNRCERKSKDLIYKNCYWVYQYEYENDLFSWNKFLNYEFIVTKEKSVKLFKNIQQYDKSRNLIKTWTSYKDIRDAGFELKRIQTICKHQKNQKTYLGYIWTYEGYDFRDGYFDSILNPINKHIEEQKKSVLQINQNGEIVNQFCSMADAGRAVGTNWGKISWAVSHRTTAKGYVWVLIDDTWFTNNDLLQKAFDHAKLNVPKRVAQYDLLGHKLQEYSSITEAARIVNTNVSNIVRAAKYSKTCAGFKWVYLN